MTWHAPELDCEAWSRRRNSVATEGSFRGALTMRAIIAIVLAAAALAACSPDNDVTGSIGSCANKLFSPFNPRDMKQCVAACITCDRGVTTTCSTSCTLKGAR